jgi:hypothetical protein
MEREYLLVGNFSVSTSIQELRDQLGHCFEPTPSGRPVVALGAAEDLPVGLPEGCLVFFYPDHKQQIQDLLEVSLRDSSLPLCGQGEPYVYGESAGNLVDTVTATQVRLWLFRRGISLDAIRAMIESIPDEAVRGESLIQWEYAPYVERSHPIVAAIGQSLGLTQEGIDAAFLEASQL